MFRLALTIIACALAAPVVAQTTPDIIINGKKTPDRKDAESYVGAISVRSGEQLARFHQPVCPLVIGIATPYSTTIENRIMDDARRVGLDVAKTRQCDANLIVVIAGDGANLVKDIRINRPGWLEGLTPNDIDRLIEPGPVRAWNVTSLRNEDGKGIYSPPAGSGDGLADKPTLRVMSASIIKLPTRRDMEAGFVVIDQSATLGLTLRQIADYAAMRGFAKTRSPGGEGTPVGTILTLFDQPAEARAKQLTDADTAYLRALYSDTGGKAAVSERASIARRIAKGK